jgi:hypothetical protein
MQQATQDIDTRPPVEINIAKGDQGSCTLCLLDCGFHGLGNHHTISSGSSK